MSLRTDAIMEFRDYEVQDDGILLHFVCLDPGGGEPNDYYILLTDDELAAISTQAELRDLVEAKLERKLRATFIASKLDQFIGQSLVI